MNVMKLKGKMVEKGWKVAPLASYIGMDKSTLYKKLSAGENFTIGEAKRIQEALELTFEEATDIFFGC